MELTLFSTRACHLCEQALLLLQPWLNQGWSVREVDISACDELFARYGLSIPVLRIEDNGAELSWPFGSEEIGRFLSSSNGL